MRMTVIFCIALFRTYQDFHSSLTPILFHLLTLMCLNFRLANKFWAINLKLGHIELSDCSFSTMTEIIIPQHATDQTIYFRVLFISSDARKGYPKYYYRRY